jgi:predicted NBD/HSP70 family sugar kinase
MMKHTAVWIGLVVLVLGVSIPALAQQTPSVSAPTQEAVDSGMEQALTYLDTAAKYLGQGVLYLLNMITDDRVSSGLEKPIGYLTLITLLLILFGLLDVARRVIWIGIIVGWALLIVRIILDALNV